MSNSSDPSATTNSTRLDNSKNQFNYNLGDESLKITITYNFFCNSKERLVESLQALSVLELECEADIVVSDVLHPFWDFKQIDHPRVV